MKTPETWQEARELILCELSEEDLLCQLAEETAELGHAALKMRRAITGNNPTPVSAYDAKAMLFEEVADVLLCCHILGIEDESVQYIQREKALRWLKRLEERRG